MHTYIDEIGRQQTDRRQNLRLRTIYDDARGRIEHCFHHRQDWAGSSIDHLALRIVHEAYPDLTAAEVRVLVEAIERKTLAANTHPPH